MNQHDHKHHDHGQHHHGGRKSKPLHKNWIAWVAVGLMTWVAVGLMLAAMVMYVLSDDESLQPDDESGKGFPIDSPPVEAAP
jgi:hypothetical protein